MSGGVDSSVAACLLLEQGYDVIGAHMNLVHLEGVEHGCCGPSARRDAAAVAEIAGFPFEVCDLTPAFRAAVIDDFVEEHAAGRTPNPCARCNGEIKFGAFLHRADEVGADLVATGHYVRSVAGHDGRWRLRRGADAGKDQSYMLHMLGQGQLARSRFPVGAIPKAETRAHAERFGLPVATKPDSQELCFAPAGDAGAFVRSEATTLVREGGEVVDTEGRVLTEHDGRSRSRSGSAVDWAWRSVRPSMSWMSMRRRTGWSWVLRRCSRGGGWWRIARTGWPARPPPTAPSRPRCGSATAATTCRRW